MTLDRDFIWVEKYRPKTIDECILPERIKKTFNDFLAKGELPNMLLSGPPGIGKTTVAKALCKQMGLDSYVINGSDEGRFLDTVRNQAKSFASTVSLTSRGKHKVITVSYTHLRAHETTPPMMFNYFLGQMLNSSIRTADSFLRAITRIEL